jgi:hypothetical protein
MFHLLALSLLSLSPPSMNESMVILSRASTVSRSLQS